MSIRPKRLRYNVGNDIIKRKNLITGGAEAEPRITTASLQDGSAMNGANVVTVPDVQ